MLPFIKVRLFAYCGSFLQDDRNLPTAKLNLSNSILQNSIGIETRTIDHLGIYFLRLEDPGQLVLAKNKNVVRFIESKRNLRSAR